jgi:hypothetical protein
VVAEEVMEQLEKKGNKTQIDEAIKYSSLSTNS